MEAQIQKQHLLTQAGVLANLKSSKHVTGLRLRFQIRCGLGLNQNLLFLDGHYLSFQPQFH